MNSWVQISVLWLQILGFSSPIQDSSSSCSEQGSEQLLAHLTKNDLQLGTFINNLSGAEEPESQEVQLLLGRYRYYKHFDPFIAFVISWIQLLTQQQMLIGQLMAMKQQLEMHHMTGRSLAYICLFTYIYSVRVPPLICVYTYIIHTVPVICYMCYMCV